MVDFERKMVEFFVDFHVFHMRVALIDLKVSSRIHFTFVEKYSEEQKSLKI
jgi:hypothetical protein